MAIVDSQIRIIKCDIEGCDKPQLTFDIREQQQVLAKPENAWVKGLRTVSTADGRNFAYCSDEHEVKGTATGKHNIPEPKRIVETGNPSAVAAAAQLAQAREAAEKQLRDGGSDIKITG
jgi:hypothetical protein